MLLLVGCTSKEDVTLQSNVVEVTFVSNAVENVDVGEGEFMTPRRAGSSSTLQGNNLTDLWLLVDGDRIYHQSNTESSFGSLSIPLTYGTHSLSFFASRSDAQAVSSGVLSCDKVLDSFGWNEEIEVGNSSARSVDINLSRKVWKLKIVTLDDIPEDVTKMTVLMDTYYSDFDLNNQTGINSNTYSRGFDITASQRPSGGMYAMYGYTSGDREVTVTFYKGNVEYRTITKTLPLTINKVTTLTGYFLPSNSTPDITISSEWDTEININVNTSED